MLKSMTPARVQVKNADEGFVEAVFATLNVIDKDGDVILPGAITEGTKVAVSAYGHSSWGGELPIGKGTIHEVGDELVAKLGFFMETSHGRDAFHTVKGLEEMGEWSFSLQEITSTDGEWQGKQANIISRIGAIKEVSPVFVGAGVNTRTLATKGADLKFSEHCEAVLAAVKALRTRASEVVALRAEKGKSLGDDATKQLTALVGELDGVRALLDEPEPPTPEGDEPDPAAEALRQAVLADIFRTQGVTNP